MNIEGRNLSRHPLAGHGEVEVRRYRDIAATSASPAYEAKHPMVLAAIATDFGVVQTAEGAQPFGPGDYIVSDIPVSHAWPVDAEAFEATYAEA